MDEPDQAEVVGLLRGNKVELTEEDKELVQDAAADTGHKPLQRSNSAAALAGGGFKGWVAGLVGGGANNSERRAFLREMITQTFPVLVLALIGASLTGALIQKLQTWPVFVRVEELFILTPILLNLKGNLEMTLSARFSTSANIGELDLRATRKTLVVGNLSLLQAQALIVSLLSGLLAFVLGLLSRRGVHHALQHPVYNPNNPMAAEPGTERGGYFEASLVLCVSMLAAGMSSAVLGSFMCSVVVLARRFRINPDNLSTPLAATLGDLITLTILAGVARFWRLFMGSIASTLILVLLVAAIGFNIIVTFKNAYVHELLTVGFGPLLLAMAISSGSGVVLETYINQYTGFALLSTVLTAVSGGASTVFCSRLATALHSGRREHYWLTAGALYGLTGVVMAVCLVGMAGVGAIGGSVGVAVGVVTLGVQIPFALLLAYWMTNLLWKFDYDPDIYALPLLTSLLDVTGQLLLVGAYMAANRVTGGAAAPPPPSATASESATVAAVAAVETAAKWLLS